MLLDATLVGVTRGAEARLRRRLGAFGVPICVVNKFGIILHSFVFQKKQTINKNSEKQSTVFCLFYFHPPFFFPKKKFCAGFFFLKKIYIDKRRKKKQSRTSFGNYAPMPDNPMPAVDPATIRQTMIKDLEDKATQYRALYHITDQFFCKRAKDQDYVMTFMKKGQEVLPICEQIGLQGGKGLAASKDQWVAQRLDTFARLNEVRSRVSKFKDMLDNYGKMNAVEQQAFTTHMVEVDKDINVHLETMVKVVREVHVDLTECSQTLYSEHDNTLLELNTQICEPLDEIITSIEKAIYPRMISVEETFVKAKVKQKYDSYSGIFAKFVTSVLGVLSWLFGHLKSALTVVANYLFIYGKKALFTFGRYMGEGMTYVRLLLCETVKPYRRLRYYTLLEGWIRSAINLSATFRSAMRNTLRVFCNSTEKKLIPFLEQTVDDALDSAKSEAKLDEKNKMQEEQPKNPKKKGKPTAAEMEEIKAQEKLRTATANYVQLAALVDKIKIVFGTGFCRGVDLTGDDGLNTDRLVALVWMIEVASLHIIGKYFVNENGLLMSALCDVKNRKIFVNPPEAVASADVPTFDINQQAIDDADIKVEMRHIPNVAEDFEKTLPELETKGEGEEQKTVFLVKGSGGIDKPKMGLIFQSLFNFFWYFAEHNFLPTKDLENKVLETYGPPAVGKDEKKPDEIFETWMKKTWNNAPGNPVVLHHVPDYVRYAYCKAQNNSAEDCLDLVNTDRTLVGLANAETRHEQFINEQLAIEKAEQDQTNDRMLQDPEDVDVVIHKIIEQTQPNAKPENFNPNLALAQRLVVKQEAQQKQATNGPNQLGGTRPVATRPVATRPVATRPVATRPVATRPVAAQVGGGPRPVVTQVGGTRPVATQPVAQQPVPTRTGAGLTRPKLPTSGGFFGGSRR